MSTDKTSPQWLKNNGFFRGTFTSAPDCWLHKHEGLVVTKLAPQRWRVEFTSFSDDSIEDDCPENAFLELQKKLWRTRDDTQESRLKRRAVNRIMSDFYWTKYSEWNTTTLPQQ